MENSGHGIAYIKLILLTGNPLLPGTHLSVKDLSCSDLGAGL